MKQPKYATILSILAATLLTAAACAHAAMATEKEKPTEKDPPATTTVSLSDYKELLTRNLFSREQREQRESRKHKHNKFGDREAEGERDRETANEREQRLALEKEKENAGSAEADIVLIGIVDRDGVVTAYLEDRKAMKTLAVKTGDTLASGKAGVITLNAMEFIAGGKTSSITFGNNLQGGTSTAKPLDASSVVGDAKGGAPAAPDPNESILEKMRRKRQAEGNK